MNSRDHSLDNCYIPQQELQGVKGLISYVIPIYGNEFVEYSSVDIIFLHGLLYVFVGTWF